MVSEKLLSEKISIPLPNDKILDQSKMTALADNTINANRNLKPYLLGYTLTY